MRRYFVLIVLFLLFVSDRAAPMVGGVVRSLDLPSVLLSGFVVAAVMSLMYKIIHNRLVEQDRAADHASVDKKHDARRI